MNRNPALKLLRPFLFAMACLACSTFLGAQQNSGAMTGAGLATTAGASHIGGVYSIDSSGLDLDSMPRLASRMGAKASNQTGMTNSRSTWMAGANNVGGASAATRIAGDATFGGRGAPSWVAGTGNFSLDRQQGGIWREPPGAGVQSNMSASSVGSSDLFNPLALTSKGAALMKGSWLSSSYASHSGFGSRAGGKSFAARHGFGNMKSQFGSRTGGFGSLGDGSGSKPATLVTPGTGKPNSPSNDDMLPLNHGLELEKTLDSDKPDSTGGLLH